MDLLGSRKNSWTVQGWREGKVRLVRPIRRKVRIVFWYLGISMVVRRVKTEGFMKRSLDKDPVEHL